MPFFHRAYSTPPGHPSTWSQRDVKHWIKSLQLDELKPVFAPLDGKALLALDYLGLAALLSQPIDDTPILEAVNDLRSTWNLPPLHITGLEPVPEEDAAAAELEHLAVDAPMSTSELSRFAKPVGVGDWAAQLQPFATDFTEEEVASYLEGLGGGMGGGLAEAASVNHAYGTVFGSAMLLDHVASQAVVARENCSKAAGLADETLRILDIEWRKHRAANGAAPSDLAADLVPEAALLSVATQLDGLRSAVQPFTQPGWLLELVCNERVKEQLDGRHNALVDALKEVGLDALPNGKTLPRGDYRDLPRAVRRLVRQHGTGSLTTGLLNLKTEGVESDGVRDLAALLEIGGPGDVEAASVVVAELAAMPVEAGLEIEAYYNNVTLGASAGSSYHDAFHWYDREHRTGYIDLPRFQNMLADLGLLEGKSKEEADAFVAASFKAADAKGEGQLGKDAFCAYYATLTTSRARQQLRTQMGLAAEEELRRVFVAFSSFGSRVEVYEIDSAHFFKLAKECGLTASNLTPTDVDIIFVKARGKGARRLNFEQFLTALMACADKRGISLEDAVRKVLQVGGPIAHATRPETVRLHDDKSTYTGVYAKGGPKAVDPPKNDLSTLLDRSQADVRGVKRSTPPKPVLPHKHSSGSFRRTPPASPVPDQARTNTTTPGGADRPSPATMVSVSRRQSGGGGPAEGDQLREMFHQFALFGGPMPAGGRVEMDGVRFQKLCRECQLFDRTSRPSASGFNATRADLIFAKVKPQGQNKIGFADFKRALALIAEAKGASVEDVTVAVRNSDGPLLTRMVNA